MVISDRKHCKLYNATTTPAIYYKLLRTAFLNKRCRWFCALGNPSAPVMMTAAAGSSYRAAGRDGRSACTGRRTRWVLSLHTFSAASSSSAAAATAGNSSVGHVARSLASQRVAVASLEAS